MTKEILINSSIGETRMALLEDGKVSEIRLFRDHQPSYIGAIYLGRVTKLSNEFQAAFVDLGDNLSGFLPLKSLPKSLSKSLAKSVAKSAGKKPKDLTGLLHQGQRIIVQVSADAQAGKSLKLTGRIEIISTTIVLHPFRSGAYVSSRIKDPTRRAELKQFGEGMMLENIGLTFRSDSETTKNTQLDQTAKLLISHWQEISKNLDKSKCPTLLSQGPEPIEQIMRQFTTSDISNIIIDQSSALKKASLWAKSFAPDLIEKISAFKQNQSLFSYYEVDDELEQISSPNVPLPSGAWITIEQTEALTAIDVNMGDALLSNDQEIQIFKVNRQAAREIFRQLRLRGIGGLIVIDFINMNDKGQIKSLLHFIDELMQGDPSPVQRGNLSSFGLLELTRQSKQINLNSLLNERPVLAKNILSQMLDILREAEARAKDSPGQEITIKINKQIKKYLESHSELLDDFQKRTGSPLKMDII